MTRVRGSVEIARPVEEVYGFVADQRNEVSCNPHMTDSTKTTEGPIGVGTRFRATILSRGKPLDVLVEYTAADRPRSITSRNIMRGSEAQGQLRFGPVAGGTRLSWDWDVSVAGPLRFAAPLVGLIGRRQERVIWTGLKRVLEEGTRTQ